MTLNEHELVKLIKSFTKHKEKTKSKVKFKDKHNC